MPSVRCPHLFPQTGGKPKPAEPWCALSRASMIPRKLLRKSTASLAKAKKSPSALWVFVPSSWPWPDARMRSREPHERNPSHFQEGRPPSLAGNPHFPRPSGNLYLADSSSGGDSRHGPFLPGFSGSRSLSSSVTDNLLVLFDCSPRAWRIPGGKPPMVDYQAL